MNDRLGLRQLTTVLSVSLLLSVLGIFLLLRPDAQLTLREGTTATVIILFGLYLLFKVFTQTAQPTSHSGLLHPTHHQFNRALAVMASVWILIFSIKSLGTRLEWDEMSVGGELWEGRFSEVINPLHSGARKCSNTNQTVTNLASFLSMKLFGLNQYSLRLPSVFFTLGLLTFLFLLIHHRIGFFPSALMYLHLICNGTFGWYSHSMKGYISLIAFSVPIIAACLAIERGQSIVWPLILFSLPLLVLSHSFGILFIFVIGAALLIWLAYSCPNANQNVAGKRLLLLFLCTLPPASILILYHFNVMLRNEDLFQNAVPSEWVNELRIALGFPTVHFISYFTVAFIAASLALFVYQIRKGRSTILQIAILIFCGFLALFVSQFRPSIFYSRFYLVFLLPFVLAIGEAAVTIPNRQLRIITKVILVFFLGVLPLVGRRECSNTPTMNISNYHQFLDRVRTIILGEKKTGGAAEQNICFTYSGHRRMEYWARHFFVRDRSDEAPCLRYHIDFSSAAPKDLGPTGSTSRELYRNELGWTLYALQAPPADK